MVADPRHTERQAFFIAALWDNVKEVVCANHHVESAPVAGVGMEYLAVAFAEHARARTFLAWETSRFVVVIGLSRGHLLFGKRYVIVAVEVVSVRRYPFEAPAHAFLECLDP